MGQTWRPCLLPALLGFLCAGLLSLFSNGIGGLNDHMVAIQRTSLAATHRSSHVEAQAESATAVDPIERSRREASAWTKASKATRSSKVVEMSSTRSSEESAESQRTAPKPPAATSIKVDEPQPMPPPQPQQQQPAPSLPSPAGASSPGSVATGSAAVADADLPEYLRGTAFVSMAAGDVAGRQAIALFSSLRTVQTRIPRMLLLLPRGGLGSADCQSADWKTARGRQSIPCYSPEAIAPEIVSQQVRASLLRAAAASLSSRPNRCFMYLPCSAPASSC